MACLSSLRLSAVAHAAVGSSSDMHANVLPDSLRLATSLPAYSGLRRDGISALPLTPALPVARGDAPSLQSAVQSRQLVVVAAAEKRRGTQILFSRGKKADKEAEPQKGGTQKLRRGTLIFRKKKGEEKEGEGTEGSDARSGGTKRILRSKPEEVVVGPPGLFDGLAKLPFAELFRGKQADAKTVYVAGGTGVVGSKIVLDLLARGFTVRLGVEESAGSSAKLTELAKQYKELLTSEQAKKLNLVQSRANDAEFTAKAISTAGKVVVALGGGERGTSSTPVKPQQALGVLEAAKLARSPTFILIADPASSGGKSGGGGGGGGGSFFNGLFSFFASLGGGGGASYSKLIDAIVDSELKFVVARTASTAGVPDSFAEESSLVVTPEGQLASGKISRVQVGALVAAIVGNVGLAEGKVFDVAAEEGAEPASIAELLQSIPVDGRRAAKEAARAKAEAVAKEREFREAAEAEARAVAAEAKAAAESLATLEAEAKRIAAEEAKAAAAAARAVARAQAASASVTDIQENLKKVSKGGPGVPPPAAGLPLLPQSVIPSFASLVAKQQQQKQETASPARSENGAAAKQRRPLRQRRAADASS